MDKTYLTYNISNPAIANQKNESTVLGYCRSHHFSTDFMLAFLFIGQILWKLNAWEWSGNKPKIFSHMFIPSPSSYNAANIPRSFEMYNSHTVIVCAKSWFCRTLP